MNHGFSGTLSPSTTVLQVLRDLALHPIQTIVRRWNWKCSLLSSVARALIFFFVNLTAALHVAVAALLTELAFRGVASGFYGAITEAFRFAKPEWAASILAMILLPLTGHSLELAVHFLRGTAKLRTSVLACICFTAVSTHRSPRSDGSRDATSRARCRGCVGVC